MRYTPVLLLACLAVTPSCMSPKEFTITTDPAGATVTINGKPQAGSTPMVVEHAQDKDLAIVVRKPGYQVGSATLRTQSSPWLSLLWTEHDPRAQYIEEDGVHIHLQPIVRSLDFRPTALPPYNNPNRPQSPASAIPALREMPADL